MPVHRMRSDGVQAAANNNIDAMSPPSAAETYAATSPVRLSWPGVGCVCVRIYGGDVRPVLTHPRAQRAERRPNSSPQQQLSFSGPPPAAQHSPQPAFLSIPRPRWTLSHPPLSSISISPPHHHHTHHTQWPSPASPRLRSAAPWPATPPSTVPGPTPARPP